MLLNSHDQRRATQIYAANELEPIQARMAKVNEWLTKTVTNLCRVVLIPIESLKIVERVKEIEPSLSAWEADNELIDVEKGSR